MRMRTTQRGIGLLELMLALAIIAILLVMATRYYLLTSFTNRVNSSITLIGNIEAAAGRWKAIYGDYKKITSIQDLIDQGMTDLSAFNAWGGPVVVKSNTEGDQISIDLVNIPFQACNNLADKYSTNNLRLSCPISKGGKSTFSMTYQ